MEKITSELGSIRLFHLESHLVDFKIINVFSSRLLLATLPELVKEAKMR